MGNSNLPPGVTEGMIPGNRPQDMEWEQLIDAVAVFIEEAFNLAEYHDKEDTPDILRALLEEYEEEGQTLKCPKCGTPVTMPKGWGDNPGYPDTEDELLCNKCHEEQTD